ncbi:MAG: GIY-YIG nuclease family protein [Bacteroidota bacterium]
MYFVYVLYSAKFIKTYIGITRSAEKRIIEHNGKKSNYTSKYVPWKVIHVESYGTRTEARKREKYLKSSAGRRWMKVNINWPRSSTG